MSTAELKEILKSKIDDINEMQFLEQLIEMIDAEGDVFEIPEEHMDSLRISLEQVQNGQTKSHSQVMKIVRNGFSNKMDGSGDTTDK